MKVLILAAGYGTRLYSLSKDTPKALLDINSRPLINYILDRVVDLSDLDEIVVVTNDKFDSAFRQWAEKQQSFPIDITIINDGTKSPEGRLGSIGDIEFVLKSRNIDDDVLVVGGDNLFDYNIEDYVNFAQKNSPSISIGLYDINNIDDAKKFGVVDVGSDKKIVSFEEKPKAPKSTLVAMCFYYLPKESLHLISTYLADTKESDTAGEYIRWLLLESDVYGFKFDGKWYDIGSVDAYNEAKEAFR